MSRESPPSERADPTHADESAEIEGEDAVDDDQDAAAGAPEDARDADASARAEDAEGARGRLRDPGATLREASGAAFRKVEEAAPPSIATRIRAFRERIRHRRTLDTAWRVTVFALGATLLVLGLIMFVVPGPGFATIILALVILGSEFAWATRVLDPVKSAAQRAARAATDPRRRRRNLTLAALLGVIAGIAVGWYLLEYGLTLGPLWALVGDVRDWLLGLFD